MGSGGDVCVVGGGVSHLFCLKKKKKTVLFDVTFSIVTV